MTPTDDPIAQQIATLRQPALVRALARTEAATTAQRARLAGLEAEAAHLRQALGLQPADEHDEAAEIRDLADQAEALDLRDQLEAERRRVLEVRGLLLRVEQERDAALREQAEAARVAEQEIERVREQQAEIERLRDALSTERAAWAAENDRLCPPYDQAAYRARMEGERFVLRMVADALDVELPEPDRDQGNSRALRGIGMMLAGVRALLDDADVLADVAEVAGEVLDRLRTEQEEHEPFCRSLDLSAIMDERDMWRDRARKRAAEDLIAPTLPPVAEVAPEQAAPPLADLRLLAHCHQMPGQAPREAPHSGLPVEDWPDPGRGKPCNQCAPDYGWCAEAPCRKVPAESRIEHRPLVAPLAPQSQEESDVEP